ncbi:MAG TPA: ABC transporter permease, partial [Gemmatimonadales bacterium]|nr:ABC transporter permease [Gemmatimonadales bacterium]
MMRWTGVRRVFRLGRAADVEREVEEELRFHLDQAARDLAERGLEPEAARREAERRFGDVAATRKRLVAIDRDRVHAERRADWWGAVRQDLRYALRGLRLRPGFALVVVLTLGLGIGANATMFGIVDRLLLKPPAYLAVAGRVHRVWFVHHVPEGADVPGTHTSYQTYHDLAEDSVAFDVVAAFVDPSVAVGVGTDVQEMHILGVTASYWRLFAMRPVVGRFFTSDENREPAGTPVAVLGYAYWRSAYAGRADAVGKTLHVGQRDYTIIGVAPSGFMGTSMGDAVTILPITAALFEATGRPQLIGDYGLRWPEIVVRRRPGVGVAAASAALTLDYQRS